MLHVTSLEPGTAPDDVLRAMFAARKRVFVDLLKWQVPVVDRAYEIDQFDDAHARYLILATRDGDHLGSARLLPTTRPHILDSLYPQLCDDGPPRGAGIFEITRFCLDRALGARNRRIVRDTLVVALADHALATGITHYSALAEAAWLDRIATFGWNCRRLGSPRAVAGKVLGAVAITIDRDTPRRLAARGVLASNHLIPSDGRKAA